MTYRQNTKNNWITVLDLDFTTQPAQTFSTDGTYTIGGYTWTKINSTSDNIAPYIDSTGLVFQPNSNGSDYNVNTRATTGLQVPLSTIIPNFDLTMGVRVWYYMSSQNFAANYDCGFVAVDNGSAATFQMTVKRGYDGGLGYYYVFNQNGQATNNNTSVTLNDSNNVTVLETSSLTGTSFRVSTGQYSSGWPALSQLTPLYTVQNASQYPNTYAASLAPVVILIGAERYSSSTALIVKFARVKIEYLSSTPVVVSRGTNGIVKNGSYSMISSDPDILADLTNATWTLTLPATPYVGERHTIKDINGYAATHPLTISGNGYNIEQWSGSTPTTSISLAQKFDSITIEFNGSFWNIV